MKKVFDIFGLYGIVFVMVAIISAIRLHLI